MITSSRPLVPFVAGAVVLQIALWAETSLAGVFLVFLDMDGLLDVLPVILLAGLLALLLPVPLGVLVDRVARRSALVWSGVAGAVALGSLVPAVLTGTVTQVHLMLALGAVMLVAFTSVLSVEAYLPAVTGRDRFVPVNALLYGVASAGALISAATMGPLYTPLVVTVLAVPAAGFVVAALLFRQVDVAEEPAPPRAGLWGEAVEGVRFTLTHPQLRAIAVYLVALSLLQRLIARPAGSAEVLESIVLLAPLVGALAAVLLHRRTEALRLAWLAVVVTSPFALLFAFPSGAIGYTLGEALPLAGAATAAIALLSHRQVITPPRLLGRSGGTLLTLVALAAIPGVVLKGMADQYLGDLGSSLLPALAAAGVLAAAVPLIRSSRYEPSSDVEEDTPAAGS